MTQRQPMPSDLPTDVAQLQQMVRERDASILVQGTFIEKLKLQIAILKRLRYGRSSESLDQQIEQLELIVDELSTEQAVQPQGDAAAKNQLQPQAQRSEQSTSLLAEHLPRQTIVHGSACTCPGCGASQFSVVGEDVSEQLEFVPEHFKVIRNVRPKFSCVACKTMVQAPAASRPIAKSPVGAGLLAHVLTSKYVDHLPLYRQSEIYARQGVSIARSTLADWVGGATYMLQPLTQAIGRYVLAATKVHADDTPVPVLQPGRKTTKQGRLWAYVRDDAASADKAPAAVWFTYTPDRKAVHPQGHLKGFKGIVQADGYAGYNEVYRTGQVQEAACWAHARRKFYELAQATGSPQAHHALSTIAKLYAIEQSIRGKPPEERWRVRQAQAIPIVQEHRAWLEATLAQASKKSALGQAIQYSLNRWAALARYTDDGVIEIDNNIVERQIRPVALGKKNYLFAGSDSGGERAAAMYTLLGTAKMNGHNPERYLATVLARIADHPINKIGELLPWNLKPEALTTEEPARLAA